jgi:hypothetical protein
MLGSRAVGGREGFVEEGDATFRIALTGLGLRKYDFQQSIEPQNALFAQELNRPAHVWKPAACPAFEKNMKRAAFGCACGRSDSDLRRFRHMIRSASYPEPDVSPSTNGSLISRSANPTIASTR